MKITQFMAGKIGRIFQGRITAAENQGMYVMLGNTAEGLIPADYLKRVPKKRRQNLQPGDAVTVRLSHVNIDEMKIYFSLK
jgi:exoribonuclease R